MRMEKTMFCNTMPRVRFAMRLPSGSSERSSRMSTTSDASIAASLPTPPMETPASASTSTGASLMPSPAYSRLPCSLSLRATFSFSSGKSPA